MRHFLAAAAFGIAALAPAQAAGDAEPPPPVDFSFKGVFGTFDRNQLQRGYQVFVEACSACHSLKHIAFRNLADPGGPEFTEAEAKAIAKAAAIPALGEDGSPVDADGAPVTREGTLADYFPYQTTTVEQAALKSLYGSLPPDLSLIAKGREGGADYIHAVLVGYVDPPEGFVVPDGGNYNKYFPGHIIAMPAPISDGQFEYAETEIPRTVDQYAKDVAAFLMWTAEPKLDVRKRIGFGVVIFLSILAVLLFLSYRRVWRNVDH